MGVRPSGSASIVSGTFWLLLGQIIQHISHLKFLTNKRTFLILTEAFGLALIIQASMKCPEGVQYKHSVNCA